MVKILKKIAQNNKLIFKIVWLCKSINKMDKDINKKVSGKGNHFDIPLLSKLFNCIIDIEGNNNTIKIGECSELTNVKIFVRGDNNIINILENVKFIRGGELWIENDNCLLEIGTDTSFENTHIAVTESNSKITIGNDCMFAYDIDIRTGDSHSIIDTLKNKRTNYAKDVIIGNHVWVASHCSILKGVTILDNCVVGTRSLVTKSFLEHGCLIGGNPAKVLKNNINWDRQRL